MLPPERLVVRKDGEGNVLDPRIATALLQEFEAHDSPRRLIIQVRTQPDYDPFAMGADDELAAQIGARHAESFRQLRERVPPQFTERSLTIVKELLPLPQAVVEADAEGLAWLIADDDTQVIYQDTAMRQFLHQTLPLIEAGAAHSAGATGTGYAVAVLDSGVQRSHPMFSGKIVGEACYSTSKTNGSSGTHPGCPGSHSWGSSSTGSGEACSGHDQCKHGTHVAAIAIGSQQTPSGGPTIKGVAYAGNLVPVRTGSIMTHEYYCGADQNGPLSCVMYDLSDTVSALNWVYGQRNTLGIAAVNMSYGAYHWDFTGHCDSSHSDIADEVSLLTGAGIAVVAASGNRGLDDDYMGRMAVPACIENVVATGATTKSDTHAAYSNTSSTLDLLAPGGIGHGTPLPGTCTGSHQCVLSALLGSSYGYMFGTSMAAPHVAGAFATLRNLWPKSEASVASIVEHLKDTGLPVSITQGVYSFTKPLIQLDEALAKPTSPSYVTVDRALCYGLNWISWPASSGVLSHYELQGSYTSGYASPFSLYSGTGTMTSINVTGTTWVRARACNGPSCSAWQNGDITATYTSVCI